MRALHGADAPAGISLGGGRPGGVEQDEKFHGESERRQEKDGDGVQSQGRDRSDKQRRAVSERTMSPFAARGRPGSRREGRK